MRRVIIVGNGFIHHLGDLTNQEKIKYEGMNHFIGRNGAARCVRIADELNKVSGLFSEFDKLQSELTNFFSPEVKYEELFERLDSLLDWYKSKNDFKNVIDKKCFDALESLVDKIITEKILPVVKEFEEQELRGAYADLFRLIPGQTIGDRIYASQQESKDRIGVFTTNYDGYLIQLLRRTSTDDDGFNFSDGFGGGRYGKHLVPYEPYFSDSNFVAPLHSSYRISYYGDELVKTRPRLGERNYMPILVYMNPKKKLNYIRKHFVLRRYWDCFENWITQADEIVIYGNSLRSDPHIVDQINRAANRLVKPLMIYAAGRSPAKVFAQLSFPSDGRLSQFNIDTSVVSLDRLHELFVSPANLVSK